MVQKSKCLSTDLRSSIQPLMHTPPTFDEAVPIKPPTEEKLLTTHNDDDSTPVRAAKSIQIKFEPGMARYSRLFNANNVSSVYSVLNQHVLLHFSTTMVQH